MTDKERDILSLSDPELLIWWNCYAECPHRSLRRRLERLLAAPGEFNGPPRCEFTGREAERAWHIRASVEQRRRASDAADDRRRARYAAENLIGRRLPKVPGAELSMDVNESKLVTTTEAAA